LGGIRIAPFFFFKKMVASGINLLSNSRGRGSCMQALGLETKNFPDCAHAVQFSPNRVVLEAKVLDGIKK